MAEPLFLVGGLALTEFRLARLVQNLQTVLPELRGLQAEAVYLAQVMPGTDPAPLAALLQGTPAPLALAPGRFWPCHAPARRRPGPARPPTSPPCAA